MKTADPLLEWAESRAIPAPAALPGMTALLGALKLGSAFIRAEGVLDALIARRDITIEAEVPGELAVSLTGGPIPPGTVIPPPHEMPFVSVAGRLGQGTTTAGSVPYLRETFTNNANYVAVGGVKPDSPDALTLLSQPLVKLAHLVQIPDEFLDDSAGLESYLNIALSEGLLSKLDTEVINGDGAAGHIQGIIGLTGKSGPVSGGAGAVNVGAIGNALGLVATNSRRRPDTVVLNPADWGKIVPSGTMFPPGIVPVLTGLVPAGTGIVGAFRSGGMVFTKGGVVVQMTQSHGALFAENETVIRAEIRVAVVYFVPAAFCLITGIA